MNTESEIRDRVIEIFQKERENKDLNYNETHLLSYLTDPPKDPQTLKNTFRGSKKYFRFMDALELEFGICFRLKDLDQYYKLDQLVETIKGRIDSPKGNKIILKKRIKDSKNYHIEWTVFIVFILILLLLKSISLKWLMVLITIIWLLFMDKVIIPKMYELKQLKKMIKRLDA